MSSPKEIILVTGSSGFIGSAAIERFAGQFAEQYTVVGLDRPEAPHPPSADGCIDVDLASWDSVEAGARELRQRFGERIASVIHLAAYYNFSGEPSALYEKITVRGTERLLHALQKDFHVGQFVFSSTMLVHAPCEPGQRIDEDWPLEPKWDYPKSKVQTEELLRAQHGNIPVVLLRVAGVYDDSCHCLPLAHQIQRIRERWLTSNVFPGDTSHGQSFVHLNDLIEALVLVVERRAQLPRETVFLVGEAETPSYDELQREFGKLITQGAAADSNHVVGALVVTFAVIAWGEIARAVRYVNVLLGVWVIVAPWLLAGATPTAQWIGVAVGAAIVLLSFRRGRVRERFGAWDRCVV